MTPEAQPKRPLANHHSRRKRLIGGAVILVLLVGIGMGVHLLAEPARGHIITAQAIPKSLLRSANTQQTAQAAVAAPLTNSYFDLTLPPGYAAQAGNQTPPGMLYNQTLIKNGAFGSLVIAIAVQDLPAGGLTGDSSYQLRSGQPARFAIASRPVQGDTVRVASDNQGGVVAFWPHRGYLATISVTSPSAGDVGDNGDELAALQPLLSGWHWQ